MAKEKEHAAAAELPTSNAAEQNAPAAAVPAAAPSVPQPPHSVDESVAKITAALRRMGPQLTLAHRAAIVAAMTAHEQGPPPEPSPYDGVKDFRFSVSWGDKQEHQNIGIVAKSPREAWAKFCDDAKQWPSPKSGKIECLGPA
jgi:hypothetical protein